MSVNYLKMSKKRLYIIILAFCVSTSTMLAQKALRFSSKETVASADFKPFDYSQFFNHLDVAATLGTTGIGVDVATPVGEYVQLRAGFSYMPRFETTTSFRVQVGDKLDKKWDENGNRLQTKFDKLAGYLKSAVGYEVDDEVDMICKPTFYNFKVMADVFPFSDKRWHVTAGFFVGPSEIARAYNTTEEMPTLLSVGIWNNLYDKAYNFEPIYDSYYIDPAIEQKLLDNGRMAFHAGDFVDNYVDSKGINHKKGDPYMMEPEEKSGMVKAYVRTNRFKPYVGGGFSGAITKDKLTQISIDAGLMFWGGTPSVITHEGVDLTHDVENISGKLGRYVDTAKFFKVFPVLEVRISRRIF